VIDETIQRRDRRFWSWLFLLFFGVAPTVVLIIMTLTLVEGGAQSSRTQDRGIAQSAVIQKVIDVKHATEHKKPGAKLSAGSTYTYTYTTTLVLGLPTPVRGRTQSKIEFTQRLPYTVGTSLAVLVDPEDPGHSELPGQRTTWAGAWRISAAGTTAWILGTAGVVLLVRNRRRRADSTPPATAGWVNGPATGRSGPPSG